MNALYATAAKRMAKHGLIVLAVIFGLAGAILILQGARFFGSSLSGLLEFGYDAWSKYLLRMLQSLEIWAAATGAMFSIQFFIASTADDVKSLISRLLTGFVIGFAFTYLLVLALGVVLFIPLGLISLFVPEIMKFATPAFAWLIAAYIMFALIAIDTPRILVYVIKNGSWYARLITVLTAALLAIQVIEAILEGVSIIMANSAWRTNAFMLVLGVSLLVTLACNATLIRREPAEKTVFVIVLVYVASIITGNFLHDTSHWEETLLVWLAAFGAPVTYSFIAGAIVKHGVQAILTGVGMAGGMIIGLLIDQITHLRIIGQGWFGVLCGTLLTAGFGLAFGLMYGPALSKFLVTRLRVDPGRGVLIGVALFLGVVVGTVFGGFLAR
jgi:hypothetical protein